MKVGIRFCTLRFRLSQQLQRRGAQMLGISHRLDDLARRPRARSPQTKVIDPNAHQS
jgi:hypothetical protein